MSIQEWAEIELKHGKTDQSDVIWGKRVISAIDIDDCVTLGELMNPKKFPESNINTQTNPFGYAGYIWTVTIHKFLGDTAIHYCFKQGKLYFRYMLLVLNADLTISNEKNETPTTLIKQIYKTTPHNMKYDGRRKILNRLKMNEFNRLPPVFNCKKVQEEAWDLIYSGRMLYSEAPKIMEQKPIGERINASLSTRKHLSFNQNSKIAKLIQQNGHQFLAKGELEEIPEEAPKPPRWDEDGNLIKHHSEAFNEAVESKVSEIKKKCLWKKCATPDGYTYYMHMETGESNWNRPDDYWSDEESQTKSKSTKQKSFKGGSKSGGGTNQSGEEEQEEQEEDVELYNDVWTKDNILDIVHLMERQKKNYYSRVQPPPQFTARGLSLLSKVKIGNEYEQTMARERGILEQGRADLLVDAFLPPSFFESSSPKKKQNNNDNNDAADNKEEKEGKNKKGYSPLENHKNPEDAISKRNLELMNKMKMFSFIKDMNYFQKLANSIHDANSTNPKSLQKVQPSINQVPFMRNTDMNPDLKLQATKSERVLFENLFSDSQKQRKEYIQSIISPKNNKSTKRELDFNLPNYRVIHEDEEEQEKNETRPSQSMKALTSKHRGHDELVDDKSSLNNESIDNNSYNREEDEVQRRKILKEQQEKIQQHGFYRDVTKFSTFTNMKYLNIGNPGAYLLADVLRNDPVIVQLTLSAARMTDDGIVELCQAIPTMHRLKYLDLSSNCMTDVGAIALSEAILDHRTLRILSVAGNRIKLSGIVNIASAIVSSHINLYSKQRRVNQKLEDKQKNLSSFHFPEEEGGGDTIKDPGVVNKENRIIWCR
jgi:hypothetical protein